VFSVNSLIGISLSTIFLLVFTGFSLPYFLDVFAFTDINFVAVGDFSCPVSSTSNPAKTINNIKSRNAERVLGLGDYSYGDAEKCWIDTIKNSGLKDRLRQTVGNHETDKSSKLSAFVNEFKPYPPSEAQQYYSFNYQTETNGPKIHVLAMATEQCWSTGCAQYKFVDNDLKVASQDPSIQWIIVDYHKVMYISPNTCSSSSCVGSSSLRSAYGPLFDKYGVDIVFQGHVHNYERSKLIKYSGGSSPTIVQSSTTSYTKPALRTPGEIFATVGIGGVNFHSFSGKSSFVAFQRSNSDGFGVLDLIVTNDGKTLQGKYIPNGGSVRDQFTITKTLSSSASRLSANAIPSAINQSVLTSENTAKPITLVAKDSSNSNLQYSIVTPPLHGDLAGKRPSVVYLPFANYTGKDQFTFKANNGRTESNLATVNITVNKKGPSSNFILDNVSKALVEKEQTKSLAEREQATSNQTEPGQVQPDLTKPLIPERHTASNQTEPGQIQPDLTKPANPRKQTEANVNSTESNKISILPKEKVLPSRPIANAGQEQIASSNSQVTLDASKSIDTDGTIVSYVWTQVKGPKVLLAHPDKIQSTFQPPVLDKDTVLIFRLIVKDNSGLIDSDTIGVKILKVNESLWQENKTARIQTETDNPSRDSGIKMRNST
jgi:K319-like protein/Big-like domain-containing protein/calcineurin-like phosphoesterase family protein